MKLMERTRWIVRRKGDGAILCGLARQFQFKIAAEIGDTSIKTYRSEKKALSAFKTSWWHPDFEVEAVKVLESLELC